MIVRPGRMAVVLGALALAFAFVGCAAFVSREEYADYRALRMAPSDDARLLAMQAYVARHAGGAWAEEVTRDRKSHDLPIYERGKNTRGGLEFYLRAFPDGVFAAQAHARLEAIAAIEARARDDARRAEALAAARREHEDEQRRTWVTRFFTYWARTLLTLSAWGAPIEEVARTHPRFSLAFGRVPRPRCTAEECVKYYESRFAVPVPGGTRIERSLQLLLRLRLREGRLVRAEVLLPGWGFSRWNELEERRTVIDALPDERSRAVAWARGRAEPLLAALPGTWTPEPEFRLGAVSAPAIGPTGELVDTSAEDPAAPANRIERAPGAGGASVGQEGTGAEPATGSPDGWTTAAPPEAPDMVLDTLRVNRDGRLGPTGGAAEAQVAPATPGGDEVMVLDPMAVPQEGAHPGAPAPAGAPRGAPAQVPGQLSASPRVEQAFRNGALRVVVFAAGTGEGAPAYDGIAIERVEAPPVKTPGASRVSPRR
jgi:hypothetical protein